MARILVIDDHAGVRTVLQQMLLSAGHEVVVAEDSRDGMRCCQSQPANAVIADLFTGDPKYVERLVELHRSCPEVPFIAMSADGGLSAMAVAQRLGAVAILQKPFFLSQLEGAVEKALHHRKDSF